MASVPVHSSRARRRISPSADDRGATRLFAGELAYGCRGGDSRYGRSRSTGPARVLPRPLADAGGGAELADSPRRACERELSEELGIEITPGPLIAVDWIPAPSQGFAELIYVFDGGRLTQQQIETIRLPEGELTECQFMTMSDAVVRLTLADGRRLMAAHEAARAGRGPVYLEHGNPPPM